MATGKNTEYLTELNEKRYVLGRRTNDSPASLNIGRFYALDGSYGATVEMDATIPHAVLICGKRGYGKSYTLGVLVEEIGLLEEKIRNNLSTIIIDTLGIFWTMAYPNTITSKENVTWQNNTKGIDISLYVPANSLRDYAKYTANLNSFSIKTSDISTEHWCTLFDVKPTDPFGMIITKAVLELKENTTSFTIDDILQKIRNNNSVDDITKGVAENLLNVAKSWGLFNSQGFLLESLTRPGAISVLDISHIPDNAVKQVLVSIISEQLFQYRVEARKNQERKTMGLTVEHSTEPMVWLAIDEAHLFLPNGKRNLTKQILLEKWLRQGRQPGLSIIMATQRPSSLDEEVLSHCDLIFCHRLTAQDDIMALQKLRPSYMKGSIDEIMRKIGKEKGVCLAIDDTMEEAHIIKIRPRVSWHGGGEPRVYEPEGD